MIRVATPRQRAHTLASINAAERAMLPAGWDAEIRAMEAEGASGAPGAFAGRDLTPFQRVGSLPLTAAHERAACGFGVCQIDNPACTGRCRYQDAARALGQVTAAGQVSGFDDQPPAAPGLWDSARAMALDLALALSACAVIVFLAAPKAVELMRFFGWGT